MTNAELFKKTFGMYSTELWSMPEEDFLQWLNTETVTEVSRWIPCEERLPEKEEKSYLVYLDSGNVCECRWWCLDPVFLNPTDNWRWHFMDKPQFTKVLAWMPLPEPYTERKDNE